MKNKKTDRVQIDTKREKEKENDNENDLLEDDNKKIKKESKINIMKMCINFAISIFILVLTYFVINNYNKKWQMPFYLTLWSFFMNAYYIISVTIIDLIRFFKNSEYCICYNDFVRNKYLRICFPFSISIVFLYWLLILLGDEFEYNSRSLMDNLIAFCFHGLIFIFLLFDTFSYPHINKKNYVYFDLLLITCMTFVYFIILGFGKYMFIYEPYDFMEMSSVRQIAGAAFLIYIAILDGYIVFVIISNKYFLQENEEENLNEENKNGVGAQPIRIFNSGVKSQENVYEKDNNQEINIIQRIKRQRRLKPIAIQSATDKEENHEEKK
jgi:hypothetical protein